MKILVISDTHGREENLQKILETDGTPDYLIHLGDSDYGETRIREMAGCPVYMVAGNCDFFSKLPRSAVIKLGGHHILITHGHCHYVTAGIRDLVEDARENHCDIAMFGHTHRPLLDQSEPGLTVLNPGSLSYPRQEGRRPTYMLLELTDPDKVTYTLRYV